MVMKIEPVYRALDALKDGIVDSKHKKTRNRIQKIILLTPQGKRFNQKHAKRLSKVDRLIFICGHYEGVDERIRSLVDEEISIGDYILTGGELAACVVVDAVTRLLPGVLGDPESLENESFENGLLEYPQYTRPREFKGLKVPQVLLNGNHKKIESWRKQKAKINTKLKRPDLLKGGKNA